MVRCSFVAVLLAACASSATAQRIVPRERTLNVTAHAGHELRVQNYASWGRDCEALPAPQIIIRHPPSHGSIAVRPGIATVSVLREGAADCAGHQYQGTTVWYSPAAGYVGPDQFDFDITTTRSTAHDTVAVDVR